MEPENAIKVTDLGKRYTIGKQKDASLRSTLSSAFKSAATKGDDFWALKHLNFEIKRGDVVGIIGKNGAGKSTLLKVLSQITKPTTGRIEINGRVASLLEVGTGFHPELTGRENIYLNGTILGMTRKEVKAKFDDIVEFSGVGKFIDTAVKHYSSGMYVRLAFSVAAHLEPEILIIDEVLAVGDAEFQKKCLGKMSDVAAEGRTVIFVSHDMGAVASLCNRGIHMEDGQVKFSGTIDDTLESYFQSGRIKNHQKRKYQENQYDTWDEKIVLREVSLVNDRNEQISTSFVDEKVGVQIDFEVLVEDMTILPIPNLHISHSLGGKICVCISDCDPTTFSKKGVHQTTVWIDANFMNNGYFLIGVGITTFAPFQVHVADYDAIAFEVLDNLQSHARQGYAGKIDGYVRPVFDWTNKNGTTNDI